MEDMKTKTIGSVTVGKRFSSVHGKEVSIRNVVQEYFNFQADKTEWRIIYGLGDDGTSTAFQRFASREEALAALEAFKED